MTQPPVFTWATAAGGNVVTGLTATDADWIENTTLGLVTYGVIEYTFSGSPDLSAALPGHVMTVSGFTNTLNNGSFVIQTVDNATKKIRALQTARLNASDDESGASASASVITSGALKQPPTSAKQGQGYVPNELPNAQQLNWMLNNFGSWTNYIANDSPGCIVTADLTELAAVDTTGFTMRTAISEADGFYYWVAGNLLPVSSPNVIDSDVSGQWVRLLSVGGVTAVAAGDGIDVATVSGTATVSVIEVGRANYAEVNQSAHGFAVGEVVRHNGTTWVKAQGNSIAGATAVWVVVAVPDVDNFTVLKEGRITLAAHGLGAANTLLYLDAATAGATTSTKPVGSNTQPLGFFLPVIFVESTDVIHVLGKSYPEINPVYAEYIQTSGDLSTDLDFTNLDLDVIKGGLLRLEMNCQQNTSSTDSTTDFSIRINGVTSGYSTYGRRMRMAVNPFTFIDYDNTSAIRWEIGYGTRDASTMQIQAKFYRRDSTIAFESKSYHDEYSSECWGFIGESDISSIRFEFSSATNGWQLRAADNHYIRLFWDGPA